MKYPRTYHLPWSEGITDDDKVINDVSHLIGETVVITEKLDGENTSLYCNKTHARSLDSAHHPSRSFVKQRWSEISYKIPMHIQVVVENMYAKHSIFYDKLTSFMYGICAIENDKIVMSWEDSVRLFNQLDIEPVPTMYYGMFDEEVMYNLKHANFSSKFGKEFEGYVIRLADEFNVDSHKYNVLKYVRKDHVQSDIHWTKEWTPNKLI